MHFLDDVMAQNMSDKLNKEIKNIERDGFMVLVNNGEMVIVHRLHPWAKNSFKIRERAIKNLQKEIGGEYSVSVFDEPTLSIDVSSIKSARCNRNRHIFAFNEYVEVVCQIDDDNTVVIPVELESVFKSEFPTVPIRTENHKWEFVEYDGEYPCLCSGDTVLKSGNTTIRTKIINHEISEWNIRVPKVLSSVKLPSELMKWNKQSTQCCGGCNCD